MDPETKAYLVRTGAQLVKQGIHVLATRPRAPAPAETPAQAQEGLASKQETKPQPSTSGKQGTITRAGLDATRVGWQEDLTLGETWLLEGHLKENCQGCGGDIECCWKHSDNLVRVAGETLSMTTDPFWVNLKALGEYIRDRTHPDDVKAGTYVVEYPALVVRLSEFRVLLQKKAMARAKHSSTTEAHEVTRGNVETEETETEETETQR